MAASRSFRPSWPATALLLALAALFAGLGAWQQSRATQKAALIEAFDGARRLDVLPARPDPGAFTRVRLEGRFDPQRHVLVDNQVHEGRPGVHVLTPFTPTGQNASRDPVLVNRGWLPQGGDRTTLPDIPGIEGVVEISGHLAPLVNPGVRLGEPVLLERDRWPQRTVYPTTDDISAALGNGLYPLALYLDADSPGGFEGRDWRPVIMGPDRHKAYALQWYALAATAIAAWAVLGFQRGGTA